MKALAERDEADRKQREIEAARESEQKKLIAGQRSAEIAAKQKERELQDELERQIREEEMALEKELAGELARLKSEQLAYSAHGK